MYTNEEVVEKFGDRILEFHSLYKGCASFRCIIFEPGFERTLIEGSIGEMSHEAAYELAVEKEEKLVNLEKWDSLKITEADEIVFDFDARRW